MPILYVGDVVLREGTPACSESGAAAAAAAFVDTSKSRQSPTGTGYRGRIGIFETMTVGDEMKAAIMQRESVGDITELAERDGMVRLREDGLAKAASGVTSIEEVLKNVV